MKIHHRIINTTIGFSIVAALLSPITSFAGELFKVPFSPVYQATQNSTLKDALTQVSQRSNIVFKINTEIGQDVVHQSLAATDWTSAIKSLLSDYNYTLVTEGKTVKTVIITGRAGNGSNAAQVVASAEPTEYIAPIIIAPKMGSLPVRYQNFPAGAVLAVSIPVKEIMILEKGKTTKFDSPLGQFNVAHDDTVQEADGSKTWVGHLDDEGPGYRMLVSEGPAGIMGHITTPEGTFNLESVNGQMFMVDTSKLDHVGFAGDVIHSTLDTASITANATLTLTQLKTALDTAKSKLDTANAAATLAVSSAATSQKSTSVALTAYNAAFARMNTTMNAANAANKTWLASKTSANLSLYNAAINTYTTANTAFQKAKTVYLAALQTMNNANNTVTTTKALAANALTNYNLALKAYNDASLAAVAAPIIPPTVAPPTSVKPVLDIMILYTTHTQTAAFARQRMAYLVTTSNQAYTDSGINLTLRLVYAEPTTYTDRDENSTALYNLANEVGVFAGTAAKRVQYGADLVYLFRPLNAVTQTTCGTTYLEMVDGEEPNQWLGFGVISDGSSKDAMSYSYCAINTFTHEIGHSLGLVHDREYSDDNTGAFSYSYAWGVEGSFGTIMSYKSPVVMYFSSPLLAHKCANGPCGYAETDTVRSSDQVKSVNLTSSRVVNFMPTMVVTPVIK